MVTPGSAIAVCHFPHLHARLLQVEMISQADYVASEADILRTRSSTSCPTLSNFKQGDNHFRGSTMHKLLFGRVAHFTFFICMSFSLCLPVLTLPLLAVVDVGGQRGPSFHYSHNSIPLPSHASFTRFLHTLVAALIAGHPERHTHCLP